MTVEEFVNEYNQASDKEKCIKKHILNDKYVPYAEKIARCKNIIDSTMYIDVDNKKIFKQNSPSQYMLFSVSLIDLYTDVDINFENILSDFDELDKLDLINIFVNKINEHELNTFNVVLKQLIDDLYKNERNILSYIENKIQSIGLTSDIILSQLTEFIESNEIKK